ncbi:MAG TPA: glycosyltransferase family 4 protein [Chthonomonadaceae bacterium]|nr:glycosyltransferase family 4 protein [Chthonomonadaceae bacterium]
MNILQIVSSSRTSGAEKHVLVLSDRLRRRGHQVTVLCPNGGWLPEQLRANGIPTLEMAMRGARSCLTAWHLPRIARERKIEVIHAHLTRAAYFGFLTSRLTHLPVVSSVHVMTHDFAYRRLVPKRRSQIVTVSDCLRQAMLRQGIPPSQIRTIYNGTDFCGDEAVGGNGDLAALASVERRPEEGAGTLTVRAELSLPPDAELIGLFGIVNEFKGHPILVRALKEIVAARPRAYVVCVGSVQPEMQQSLWETASADGLAERLRFTGVRNDVRRLMSEMDVVTLPSLFEACSMAIIEAMAMGKPVVATRAGGNPELIADQETGLLIERTPEALALALVALLSDAGRRRQMGAAARQRAVTRFSAGVMACQIEHLYQELLQAGAAEAATN